MRALLVPATCLLLAACSSAGGQTGNASTPALPEPASLDSLRSGSAVHTSEVDIFSFVISEEISTDTDTLFLDAPASGLSYVIYRIDPVGTELISATITASGDLWVMLPDYGTGRWTSPTELASGSVELNLASLNEELSPAGFAYLALISPPGGNAAVSAFEFEYDGPEHIFFVSPASLGGDDSADGSYDTPWATLQHAADSVSGETFISVRHGDYAGFHLERSGAGSEAVTFSAQDSVNIVENAPGRQVGINIEGSGGGNVTIEGFNVTGLSNIGIRVSGGEQRLQNITLRNNGCIGNTNFGILAAGVTGLLLERNHSSASLTTSGIMIGYDCDSFICRGNSMFANHYAGLQLYTEALSGDELLSDGLIEGNEILFNGLEGSGWGIIANSVTGSTFRNNLLAGNRKGMVLYSDGLSGCTNNSIVNNTLVVNSGDRDGLVLIEASTGNVVQNNILLNPNAAYGSIAIDGASLTGFVSDHNLLSDGLVIDDEPLSLADWRTMTGQDSSSLSGDTASTFVDALDNDFHLKDGSPAIGLASASFAPAFDLDGNSRPLGSGPDSGCFERE